MTPHAVHLQARAVLQNRAYYNRALHNDPDNSSELGVANPSFTYSLKFARHPGIEILHAVAWLVLGIYCSHLKVGVYDPPTIPVVCYGIVLST